MDLEQLLSEAKLTQAALAAKLGIKQPSVSAWRLNGIPLDRIPDIERVTGISRSRLRPDFFRVE